MAPLQKRALISLVIGLILTAALVVVFVIQGDVTAFDSDEGLRYFVYGVLISVPLVYLVLVNLTLRRPTQIDERTAASWTRPPRCSWWLFSYRWAAGASP